MRNPITLRTPILFEFVGRALVMLLDPLALVMPGPANSEFEFVADGNWFPLSLSSFIVMGVADEAPQEPVEGGWDVSDDRKFFWGG